MPALVADGGVAIALVGTVQVGVGERVQQEVGAIEAVDKRAVIVLDSVGVEQLASVVRVVPRVLQPNGQEVVVEAAVNELGIASWQTVSESS